MRNLLRRIALVIVISLLCLFGYIITDKAKEKQELKERYREEYCLGYAAQNYDGKADIDVFREKFYIDRPDCKGYNFTEYEQEILDSRKTCVDEVNAYEDGQSLIVIFTTGIRPTEQSYSYEMIVEEIPGEQKCDRIDI